MGLLERIDAARVERRFATDMWLSDYLIPSLTQLGYGGVSTTWVNGKVQEYSANLPGYAAAVRSSPPAFAAEMVRALVISQARFTFRNLPSSRTPRRTFGTQALSVLERPWTNATTGELLSRMEWHAGLAGNAYVTNAGQQGRLRILRPDWVAIIYGSDLEPDRANFALDGRLVGYAYCNGGLNSGNRIYTLLPDEVAHWSPIPDPEGAGIGMSWVSVALRDIQGDRAATDHKLKFFTNGATPNLVVKGLPAQTQAQFDALVESMEARHRGLGNAYRTLYLTAGADATVVGSDLKQLDFKATQGAGETRVAMLGRVPAPLLGISEGLAGSSLNAGNFGMARRIFADSWIFPTLQDLCGALAPLVDVPSDAELWFDTADMPILREDAKDAADIEQVKAATINSLITAGFTPVSAVAAVRGQDISMLVHTGLVSVQLQPPGAPPPAAPAGGAAPKASAATAARSLDPDGDFTDDEAVDALIEALAYFDAPVERSFNESLHPRNPKGSPGGGRFRSLVDRIIDAITEHHKNGGKGDPFDGFDREQLRKVAKARGITLDRGEPRESIAEKLLADMGKGKKAATPKAKPRAPSKPKDGDVDARLKSAARGDAALNAAPYKQWTEPDGPHKDAVYSYTGGGYLGINADLRVGRFDDRRTKNDIKRLDEAMADSPLDADVVIVRGIRDPVAVFGDKWNDTDVTGLQWTDPSFASASTNISQTGRTYFTGNTGVRMEILVPKGTHALAASDKGEAELLLDRRLVYHIVRDDGVVDGIRRLVVEVILVRRSGPGRIQT